METKIQFEINPLDLNIARMELGITKKLEANTNENIYEEFQSKDPESNLNLIQISCNNIDNNEKSLEGFFKYKKETKERKIIFVKGTQDKIIDYIKAKKFFATCKLVALEKI